MLDYNSLMKEIDHIKNCYFIYSYDKKLVKNFITKLTNSLIYKDLMQFNYVQLRLDSKFDIDEFIGVCDTMPMMQDRKIVVLENAMFLKSDYDNKEVLTKLKKYLENLPEYCIVIFYYIFKDSDKNRDTLKSFERFGETCKILELKGEDFYREVLRIFQNNNVNIKESLVRYFCIRVISDFFTIENEIKKLKVFVGDEEVSKQNIDDIVSRSFENNVFVLINNVLDNNLKKSLTILNELILGGNDFNYILSMLINHFSRFLDVMVLLEEGINANEIIKKTKINQYMVNSFVRLSSRYNVNQIIDIIDKFLDLEYRIRTVNVNELIEIEMLFVSICRGK